MTVPPITFCPNCLEEYTPTGWEDTETTRGPGNGLMEAVGMDTLAGHVESLTIGVNGKIILVPMEVDNGMTSIVMADSFTSVNASGTTELKMMEPVIWIFHQEF